MRIVQFEMVEPVPPSSGDASSTPKLDGKGPVYINADSITAVFPASKDWVKRGGPPCCTLTTATGSVCVAGTAEEVLVRLDPEHSHGGIAQGCLTLSRDATAALVKLGKNKGSPLVALELQSFLAAVEKDLLGTEEVRR